MGLECPDSRVVRGDGQVAESGDAPLASYVFDRMDAMLGEKWEQRFGEIQIDSRR